MSGTREGSASRERVLAEINEEVRRLRVVGDLPPSFEHRLDEAFDRLTPSQTEAFETSYKLAEEAAHIDIEVPVASNLVAGEVPKRLVRRLVFWYFGYVVQQMTRFTTATTKTLHLLDRRLAELERERQVVPPAPISGDNESAVVDLAPWMSLVVRQMTSVAGRVLHAECGGGVLLRALADSGVDVYGADPRPEALDLAVRVGVDVVLTDTLSHLRRLPEDSLGGLVLSGVVDRLVPGRETELIALAAKAIRSGGALLLLCSNPAATARPASVVEADLSPGRALHAETWIHLLERHGFSSVELHEGSRSSDLEPLRGSGPEWEATKAAWEAVSSNLARFDELLFPPTSFAVVGVCRD